jgi:hypothetical protein
MTKIAIVSDDFVICEPCATPLDVDLADSVSVSEAYPDGFTCNNCSVEILPNPLAVICSEWTYEDIRSLRPTLTVTEAEELLQKVSKRFLDRLNEEGQTILDNLIWFYSEGEQE